MTTIEDNDEGATLEMLIADEAKLRERFGNYAAQLEPLPSMSEVDAELVEEIATNGDDDLDSFEPAPMDADDLECISSLYREWQEAAGALALLRHEMKQQSNAKRQRKAA